MDSEEGRRTGACAIDSRLPRFLAKPKIEERRENLIEYTEEFIQARDQRLMRQRNFLTRYRSDEELTQ